MKLLKALQVIDLLPSNGIVALGNREQKGRDHSIVLIEEGSPEEGFDTFEVIAPSQLKIGTEFFSDGRFAPGMVEDLSEPEEPEEKLPEVTFVNASEEAMALAEEEGIDLSTLEGSGDEGTILVADVEAAVEAANEIVVVNASDAAVKLANENGIDLSDLEGTGQGGTITKPDVEAAIEAAEAEED